jgi:hypothetical protein
VIALATDIRDIHKGFVHCGIVHDALNDCDIRGVLDAADVCLVSKAIGYRPLHDVFDD